MCRESEATTFIPNKNVIETFISNTFQPYLDFDSLRFVLLRTSVDVPELRHTWIKYKIEGYIKLYMFASLNTWTRAHNFNHIFTMILVKTNIGLMSFLMLQTVM